MKRFVLIAVLALVACAPDPVKEQRDTEMAIVIREGTGFERTEYFYTTWDKCREMLNLSPGRIGLDGKDWITEIFCEKY